MRSKKHKIIIVRAVIAVCLILIIIFVHTRFETHKPGEPLEHKEFLEGWEVTYGDKGSVDVSEVWYNLEALLDYFRVFFNRGSYGEEEVYLNEETDFTIWINQEGTELYATIPAAESDRIVVAEIGSAGYKDYPGVWAVFDYRVIDASEYAEFEERHERYEVSNPVPLEAIPKSRWHEPGEPLEHKDYVTIWELTYGAPGFSDHYEIENEMLSFRQLFNAGYYGNEERKIQLDEEMYFTIWTNKDGTGMYATIPTKETDGIMVLQLDDAGYEDYPGIWAVFDYWLVEASDYLEFKRQHKIILELHIWAIDEGRVA